MSLNDDDEIEGNWRNNFETAHSSPRVLVSPFCLRGCLRFCVFDDDQGRKRAETARKGHLESVFGGAFLLSSRRALLLERFLSFFFFLSSFFDLFSCFFFLTSSFLHLRHHHHHHQKKHYQFHPGTDVGRGTDDTLFALAEGIVVFKVTKHERSVSVVPADKFEVPEGQRRAETSRRTKRLAQYTPRAAQREAVAAAAAAVAVPAAP